MRHALLFSLISVVIPLLAGCGNPIDGEQLRVCRDVIAAVNPDGTELRELHYGPSAPGAVGVRIDYAAGAPGEPSRVRYVACGFAGRAFSADRLDLVAVETDSGRLGDAQLFYLKRFWLGAPPRAGESVGGEPAVPVLPPSIAYGAQQFINAIALSAVYALLATAYSLIYGITGRINLAFGEIAMLGAYGAVGTIAVLVALGLDDPLAGVAVALAAAAVFSGLWSAVIGRCVIAPLHARHRLGQPILVATVGLAVALQEFLHLSQGVRDRWVPSLFKEPIALARAGAFVVTVTPMQIAVVISTLAAAAAMLWLFARTRFGLAWRAYADDPQTAALLGVDGTRLLSATFVLAGLSTGLAGAVVGVYYGNVGSGMGTMLGLKALIAALLGGIGSVPGAFLGGLVVGLIETAWSAYFDMTLRDLVIYTFLVVLFLLRPGGLFGLATPDPPRIGRAGV
ncbi:MAG TPA: branched-chain amino acid ABC transporter permease [Xanthobacteraceae bacterium]|jgi:branched-chain amino acid transport system permease protein